MLYRTKLVHIYTKDVVEDIYVKNIINTGRTNNTVSCGNHERAGKDTAVAIA